MVEIIMRREVDGKITETVLVSIDEEPLIKIKPMESVLSFPGIEIRLNEHIVYRDDREIFLTHREFATLSYLARHPKRVFTAEQIYEAVWREDGENCGTAVANIISQLRRKLTPDDPKGGYIRTVIGGGYKFEAPE